MKSPFLLNDGKYILTKNDFDFPLARNIFIAISKMVFDERMESITIIDIDNYFQQNEGSYENFKKQNGIQYLNDCLEVSNINNFDYYYNRVKKLSALRALKADGFDIKKIYDENEIDVIKENAQQE